MFSKFESVLGPVEIEIHFRLQPFLVLCPSEWKKMCTVLLVDLITGGLK